jgi:hypothetical protein
MFKRLFWPKYRIREGSVGRYLAEVKRFLFWESCFSKHYHYSFYSPETYYSKKEAEEAIEEYHKQFLTRQTPLKKEAYVPKGDSPLEKALK